jgi:hypothetical protein
MTRRDKANEGILGATMREVWLAAKGIVRRSVVVLSTVAIVGTVAAAVFAYLYFGREPATKTVVAKPCGERVFGHIDSLVREGDHFLLRFDPAWFTSGVTANTAAAEDGAVESGQPVPNDNYVVEEGHRLLTYRVPTNAHVTVLANNKTGFLATPVSVSELAVIVANGKSRSHTLFEPLDSGVWIRVSVDTACSLDQQYRP